MVLPYTQLMNSQLSTVQSSDTTPPLQFGCCHYIDKKSTRNSVQCSQHTQHHLHLDGVIIFTAYQLATQYSATSIHNTTTSVLIVSPCTRHVTYKLNIEEQAHTTTPTKFGWCNHIHSISTRNSGQCNQQTQHHPLHLNGVTIHTKCHLVTQHRATSIHNNSTSIWMVPIYTENATS